MTDAISFAGLSKILDAVAAQGKKDGLYELLRRYIDDRLRPTWEPQGDGHAQRLCECQKSISQKFEFKPGDLVQWKPLLKNRRRPAYSEPAVVVEVLPTPIANSESEAGSAYFREPLDIVLGFIDGDGEFVCFHCDSRRYTHFNADFHPTEQVAAPTES